MYSQRKLCVLLKIIEMRLDTRMIIIGKTQFFLKFLFAHEKNRLQFNMIFMECRVFVQRRKSRTRMHFLERSLQIETKNKLIERNRLLSLSAVEASNRAFGMIYTLHLFLYFCLAAFHEWEIGFDLNLCRLRSVHIQVINYAGLGGMEEKSIRMGNETCSPPRPTEINQTVLRGLTIFGGLTSQKKVSCCSFNCSLNHSAVCILTKKSFLINFNVLSQGKQPKRNFSERCCKLASHSHTTWSAIKGREFRDRFNWVES